MSRLNSKRFILAFIIVACIATFVVGTKYAGSGTVRRSPTAPAARDAAVDKTTRSTTCADDVYGVVMTNDGYGVGDAKISVIDSAGVVRTGVTDDDDGYYDILGMAKGPVKVMMTPPTGMGSPMSGTVSILTCGGADQDFLLPINAVTPQPGQ